MVSVIIPVYNTEKSLLLRCLDSILLQAFPDYEIIIVDDGCKTLAQSNFIQIEQMDSRIKILHQQNRGVSAARNAGVNAATGEYVAFVDGDDEIDSRFLADSVSTAVQSRADIVVGAIQYVREDGSVCRIDEDDTPYCFDQQDLISARRSLLKLPQKHFPYEMLGSPCGRLIRRELCLSTPFHESIHYLEDQLFVRSLFLKANRIVKYYDTNPKNFALQPVLSSLFRYFSDLLLAFYAPVRSEEGIAAWLEQSPWLVRKNIMPAMRNYSAMKVFQVIREIRKIDGASKGVGGQNTSDGDLLKELVFYILH